MILINNKLLMQNDIKFDIFKIILNLSFVNEKNYN